MRSIKVGDDASYEDTADNDETDTEQMHEFAMAGSEKSCWMIIVKQSNIVYDLVNAHENVSFWCLKC